MKNAELLKEDRTRLTLLEECEHRIGSALRRGLDATIVIGRELQKIAELELYTERGYKTINQYCLDCHNFDHRSVSRFLAVTDTVKNLKDAGLQLPENESQVVVLAQLDRELQPVIWERAMKAAEIKDEPITVYTVEKAIELHQRQLPPPSTTPARGVRTPLDEPEEEPRVESAQENQNGSEGRVELPHRMKLSEEGEAALERIRRTCGEIVADAIASLRKQLSERELIYWSQQDNPAALTYYVMDQDWTVPKAVGFVDTSVTDKTSVSKLFLLARGHGGQYQAVLDQGLITVEITA